MNDTISRADALAAIEGIKYGDIDHDAETFHHDDALNNALAAINALPASNVDNELERRKQNELKNCLNWGPCSLHDKPMSPNPTVLDAMNRIASIKADDGDDFSEWNDATVIRCEITVADLKAVRSAVNGA